MNKEQFLAAIRERLAGLPLLDIERAVEYYNEVIDDHIEDGMTAEEAVAAVGTVEEVAAQIAADAPMPAQTKSTKHNHTWRIWEIVLLILGSPIWVPLLLTVLAIGLSVYIVLWSVVITLYAVDLSFAASGLVGIAGSIALAFTGHLCQSVLFVGAGLVCVGAAILLFFALNQATIGVIKLSRWMIHRVGSLFIRKDETK